MVRSEDNAKHMVEYTEQMKKELEEKEAKYADMDAEVEAASVTDMESEEEDGSDGDDVRFRDGEDEETSIESTGQKDWDERLFFIQFAANNETRTLGL